VIHLQSYIEDKSNKAEDRAKGKGILKKVMEYKLIWLLHFMRDILMKLQSSGCNPSKHHDKSPECTPGFERDDG